MRHLLFGVLVLALLAPAGTVRAALLPSQVNDLVFWVDASDIDGNGQPDGLSGGAPIGEWVDKASGNNASQSTSTLQPTLNLGAVNGLPAVTFASDYLATGSQIITGTSGRTIFAVAQANDTGSNQAILSLTSMAGGDPMPDGSFYTLSGEVAVRLKGYQLFDQDIDSPDFSVLSIANATGAVIAGIDGYLNGVQMGVADQGLGGVTIDTRSSGESLIGVAHTGNTYFNGSIAELIVYDRELAPGEMWQVTEYLGLKYGIDVVPEPSSVMLLLAATALALLWRRR